MNGFKRYLSAEIVIDFKVCMYFYCIMVFYCIYRLIQGNDDVSILLMIEMIFTNYVMCNIQVYLLRNFDESEHFGLFELMASIGCCLVYVFISIVGNWFEKNAFVTVCFFAFMMFSYFCLFLVYKVKREIDTKELNKELEAFKKRQ